MQIKAMFSLIQNGITSIKYSVSRFVLSTKIKDSKLYSRVILLHKTDSKKGNMGIVNF